MRRRLKQTEEDSWYESSETNNMKPVATVTIKGPPWLNFSSSCREAKERESQGESRVKSSSRREAKERESKRITSYMQ